MQECSSTETCSDCSEVFFFCPLIWHFGTCFAFLTAWLAVPVCVLNKVSEFNSDRF